MMLTDEEILHRVQTHVGGVNPGNLDNSDWIGFARAVIAENNKKVLADLKPIEKLDMLHAFSQWEYYKTDAKPQYYSADQVAALIQERDALAAKLQASDSAYAELDNELQQVRQQLFDRT